MRRSLLTYIILVFVLTYSIEGLVYLIGGLQAFNNCEFNDVVSCYYGNHCMGNLLS